MRAVSVNVRAAAVGGDQSKKNVAPQASSRRELLLFTAAAVSASPLGAAFALPIPPAPQSADCADCIGEINNTLNACSLESQSCVSTLNDDEVHFAAPWEHDLTTEAAVAQLIEVATGGAYEPGLINEPFGVSRGDAGKRVTMF